MEPVQYLHQRFNVIMGTFLTNNLPMKETEYFRDKPNKVTVFND